MKELAQRLVDEAPDKLPKMGAGHDYKFRHYVVPMCTASACGIILANAPHDWRGLAIGAICGCLAGMSQYWALKSTSETSWKRCLTFASQMARDTAEQLRAEIRARYQNDSTSGDSGPRH